MTVHNETAADPGLDATGLECLYRSHWASLVRLAWLTLASREDAEDVVQTAFIRLEWSSAPIDNHFAYLRRIVVNLVLDEHRKASVANHHRPEPAPPVLNPETEEIWTSVQRLPVRQRQALVLRFYADLTFEQIASDMDCPVGTVKSLVHRGLTTLRGAFQR